MFSSVLDSHGVCLHRDAVATIGRRAVAAALARGRLVSPWRGVLVCADRADQPSTLAAAALQLSRSSGLLSGPTAAHLHGCDAVPVTPVHLVVPYRHRFEPRPGIIVHNATGLDADRVVVDELPVLRLERVVTDLLCTARPQDALAVTDQALRSLREAERPAFRRELRRRIGARPDIRGTCRAAMLVEIASDRAESPAESWTRWLLVEAGFPLPEVNHWVLDIDGRRLHRVDLAWPDLRIAVEHDGYAAHAGREEADRRRTDDLRRRGWIIVTSTAGDLASPTRLIAALHAAFRTRGVVLRLAGAA